MLGDGGYLVELERRGALKAEPPFAPTVALDRPDALLTLHREFVGAGSRVLQALTFWTTTDKLAPLGFSNRRVGELNRAAVRLARRAAGARALVAGTITHSFVYWHADTSRAAEARALFREQAAFLAAAGADFLILETFFCAGEIRMALEEARRTGLPLMATMSFRPHLDRSEDQVPAEELGRILAGEGAAIVGVNCEQSPDAMLPIVAAVRHGVPSGIPVAAQPCAFRTTAEYPYYTGRPEFGGKGGLETVQVGRAEFTEFARRGLNEGVSYFGGCCGCNAAYIRALAAGLAGPAA